MKNQKKTIYYWCPFIGNVATIDAVLNSIISLKKYSNDTYQPYLINVVGEWDSKKEFLKEKKIHVINFRSTNIINYLPKRGFFKSRFTYFIIFFLSILKLHKILKKNKPEFLVIHLITFIPLFLILFNKYKTKFKVMDWEKIEPASNTNLIINTTSCGMKRDEEIKICMKKLKKTTIYSDIIYNPRKTQTMKNFEKEGFQTQNGLGMLINQAAESFRLWFGINLTNQDIIEAKELCEKAY